MNNKRGRGKDQDATHEVESYGFKGNFAVRSGPSIFIGIVLFLAVTVGVIGQISPRNLDGVQLISAIVTIGVFVLGYQQWRAARNEISMDKFYDRLDLANRRLDAWPAARAMVSHLWPLVPEDKQDINAFERVMYIYMELDNLQYVAEKYKLGYMNSEQALQGLRTFQSRCFSSDFRKLALHYVERAGYNSTVREIVKRVCKDYDILDPPSSKNINSIPK